MLEVRRCRADEWRKLRALRLESLQDSPDAFWKRYDEELDTPAETWQEWIASPTFVAVEDERFVGMAVGARDRHDRRLADLFAMYVTPEARRRGIAKLLVEAVVEWARADGFDRVQLMVNVANPRAVGLYERCGFCETGEREPLRDTQHTLAVMTRAV